MKAPCRRLPASGANTDYRLTKLNEIRDPTRMVFLFDGIYMNIHNDGDRVSARHGSRKGRLTNILFFDGHAESISNANALRLAALTHSFIMSLARTVHHFRVVLVL